MSRPAVVLVGLLVLAAAPAAVTPAAGSGRTSPRAGLEEAIASYRGAPVSVPGVTILRTLPGLGQAIVTGTQRALAHLAASPGVSGLVPNDHVQLTGDVEGVGGGVYASAGLGGRAGKRDAGRGVRVAVVDTGVTDSPALNRASGRLVDGFSATDAGSGPFTDGYGHGTFMASVVAGGPVSGTKDRAVGVAPGAQVVVVKVASSAGETSLGAVLAGLDWVVTHRDRVDVANLSFSHARPGGGYGGDPLTAAVEKIRAVGIVAVVSAGNEPGQVGDPGFDPQALTVGAADLTDGAPQVAPFSGSGTVAGVRKPDLVASGMHVLGVLPAGSVVANAHPEAQAAGGLWRGSGTSQATAVTTGAVAMFLQAHPAATPVQVKASLRAAADELADAGSGSGLLTLTHHLLAGTDGPGASGSADLTGEGGFDASSWSASSWSASSWSASSWSASSWSSRFEP